MTAPRVTVLLSFFNDERYLGHAIESVLRQTYADFELLLINDGSTDRSREIAAAFRDPRIVLVDNEANIGLTKSLNRGLRAARGELIARLDGNDVALPDRLAKQVAFLDTHPNVLAVGGQARYIRPNGAHTRRHMLRRPVTADGLAWALMLYSALAHPAATFRKAAALEIGGYDERFVIAQDMTLWSGLARRGELANLADVVIEMRLDPSSISGFRSTARRMEMLAPMAAVLGDNIRHFTGQEALPPDWPALWLRVLADRTCTVAEILRAVVLIGETRERFAAARPSSARNREIADATAFFYEQAAFALGSLNRLAAARTFARAARSSPMYALGSAPRMAARLLLGSAGVNLWRRVVHRDVQRHA